MMLLLAAHALYVGNNACGPCHAEILRTYSGTPMARSSGRLDENIPAASFRHAASGVEYRIDSSGLVRMSRGSQAGQRLLDYFIGSGMAGQSFLSARDGFLFEAPVTWYSQESRWNVSPGYEADPVSRWSRAVEPACLNCHASQVRSAAGFQNLYADPPFAQSGIGCERCHGPGSEHIAGKAGMVNPAKLDSVRRDAVCSQCHMSGEVRVGRPGHQLSDYRPGDLLSDYVAYFVSEGATDLKATGYVEKLAASQCRIGAGDRLWCGTCHEPHRVPAAAAKASWYEAKCRSCHEPADCKRGVDCTGCHMPRVRVADVNHGMLTDHSIPRISGVTPKGGGKESWKLKPFSPRDAGDRELGLAYAEVSATTNDPRQRAEALRLLSAASQDEAVQLRLAGLYAANGDTARSAALYRSVLQRNARSNIALVNLGRIYGAAGQLDEAIALWKSALKLNPCLSEAAMNLGVALKAKGDLSGSRALADSQSWCVFP